MQTMSDEVEVQKVKSGERHWLCGKGLYGLPTLGGACETSLELIVDQRWYRPEGRFRGVMAWEVLGYHSKGLQGRVKADDEIEMRKLYGCRYVLVTDATDAEEDSDES